jgi:hypothetical protein
MEKCGVGASFYVLNDLKNIISLLRGGREDGEAKV